MIALARFARARRALASRALHAACREILARTVEDARAGLAAAPLDERIVRVRRLRKLEALEAYAAAMG